MNPGQLAAVLRTPDTTAFASIKDAQGQQATWENTRMVIGVGDEEVIVDDWHDHAKHIAVHNELRSGPAYRMAPPEVQDFIDLHIETHAQLKAELEMEAMRAQMPLMPPPPMGGEGPPPPGDEVAA
jgi:hypothetical protein